MSSVKSKRTEEPRSALKDPFASKKRSAWKRSRRVHFSDENMESATSMTLSPNDAAEEAVMALHTSTRCRSHRIDLDHDVAVILESDSESYDESDDESDDESAEVSALDEVKVQPTAKVLSILDILMSARSSDEAPPDALIRQGMSDSESDD
jgi:hypothetical protein